MTQNKDDTGWYLNNFIQFEGYHSNTNKDGEDVNPEIWVGPTEALDPSPGNIKHPGMVNFDMAHINQAGDFEKDIYRHVNIDIPVEDAERIALLILMAVKEQRDKQQQQQQAVDNEPIES